MQDIFFEISAKDWSEIIRNYILAAAAVVTAALAWRGFNLWQEQSVWKDDRTFAKEILVEAYKLQKRIWDSRDPVIRDIFYMNYGLEVEHSPTPELMSNRDTAYYQKIASESNSHRTIIEPILLQARAIWGNEISDTFESLLEREKEQNRKILRFAVLKNREGSSPSNTTQNYYERLDKRENEMLRDSESSDSFDKETAAIIAALEQKLTPKLGKRA